MPLGLLRRSEFTAAVVYGQYISKAKDATWVDQRGVQASLKACTTWVHSALHHDLQRVVLLTAVRLVGLADLRPVHLVRQEVVQAKAPLLHQRDRVIHRLGHLTAAGAVGDNDARQLV